MGFIFLRIHRIAWAALAVALAGCSNLAPAPVPLLNYQPEAFNADAFSRHYEAPPGRTCEAVRRALLSQGYELTSATAHQVTARKYFQPDPQHHVQLEFRAVCVPERDSPDTSVAFISGVEDQYVARKAKESASVGVASLASLSLPIEGGMDAMVKVSSKTVTDPDLYDRLFTLVSANLDQAVDAPAIPATVASAPAPASSQYGAAAAAATVQPASIAAPPASPHPTPQASGASGAMLTQATETSPPPAPSEVAPPNPSSTQIVR
jgi:hypothetical protein